MTFDLSVILQLVTWAYPGRNLARGQGFPGVRWAIVSLSLSLNLRPSTWTLGAGDAHKKASPFTKAQGTDRLLSVYRMSP